MPTETIDSKAAAQTAGAQPIHSTSAPKSADIKPSNAPHIDPKTAGSVQVSTIGDLKARGLASELESDPVEAPAIIASEGEPVSPREEPSALHKYVRRTFGSPSRTAMDRPFPRMADMVPPRSGLALRAPGSQVHAETPVHALPGFWHGALASARAIHATREGHMPGWVRAGTTAGTRAQAVEEQATTSVLEEWEIKIEPAPEPYIAKNKFNQEDIMKVFSTLFKELQEHPKHPDITLSDVVFGQHPNSTVKMIKTASIMLGAGYVTSIGKYFIQKLVLNLTGRVPDIRVFQNVSVGLAQYEAWLPGPISILASFPLQMLWNQSLVSGGFLINRAGNKLQGLAPSPKLQIEALAAAFIEANAELDSTLEGEQKKLVDFNNKNMVAATYEKLTKNAPVAYWDENNVISDEAETTLEGYYSFYARIRLTNVGPLLQTDAEIAATKGRMSAAVSDCLDEVKDAFQEKFIDKYGEPTKINRMIICGGAGMGKSTLIAGLIEAMQKPSIKAKSMAQLLSKQFDKDLVELCIKYGRNDIVIHAHEMSLESKDDSQEKLRKDFLDKFGRDGKLVVTDPVTKAKVTLDVLLIFDDNESFIEKIFPSGAGLLQAGADRTQVVIKVTVGPKQREKAATVRRDELSKAKLDSTKLRFQGLVREERLSRADASVQWAQVKAQVARIEEAFNLCLPTIHEAGNKTQCSMSVVRRVVEDVYTRMTKYVGNGKAVSADNERLYIFTRFEESMKDPVAPPEFQAEIAKLKASIEDAAH